MFITYAQNREDVILDAYFRDVQKGFYIDIGANHPINDSVTKHFYETGWTGINVEPIEALHELLEQDRPLDTNLNMGVSNGSENLVLRHYSNDGLSTFSDRLKEKYSKEKSDKTAQYVDVEVKTIKLKELFKKYVPNGTQVQFLKIDVEGFELDVILSNDWVKFRPEMVCVETNHTKDDAWRNKLDENDYLCVYDDGLNEYYLATESLARKKNFSYVDTMLLGPQIMPFHVHNKIEELESEIKDRDINLEIQSIHLKQLEKEKVSLEKLIVEQQRFKSTVKMFVKALDKLLIARIEDLRKPMSSGNKSTPHQSVRDRVYDTTSKEALLRSMRHNDLLTFYTRKNLQLKQNLIVYKAVKFSYKGIRSTIRLPYIFLKKKLAKDRNK